MTEDLVENGTPIGRRGWTALLVLALAGCVVATRAATTPKAPRAVPVVATTPLPNQPLLDYTPAPSPLGNRSLPDGFVRAPYGAAADAMTLTVVSSRSAVRIATADDSMRALYRLGEHESAQYHVTADGWVLAVSDDRAGELDGPTVRFHTRHGETTVATGMASYVVAGHHDVWVSSWESPSPARRYDTDGRLVASGTLEYPWAPYRALDGGDLLVTDGERGGIARWRPGGGLRRVAPRGAFAVGANGRHVVWIEPCASGRCPLHVTNVDTRADWTVVTTGAGALDATVSDDGRTVAFATDDGNGTTSVLAARRGDRTLRAVASADSSQGAFTFSAGFARSGRLCVVERSADATFVAYSWDPATGRLAVAGVYEADGLETVTAD